MTHEGVKQELVMRQMRGNLKSRILLVAPPPSLEEYKLGLPLSDRHAQAFHEWLLMNSFNTEKDCIVIAASAFRAKANRASTVPIISFIRSCSARDFFNKYIVVGDAAFSFAFGEGRKTTMSTLAGSVIHIKDVNHKPMFVFPSITKLNPEPTGDDRAEYIHQRIHREVLGSLSRLLPSFRAFVRES